MYKVINVQDIDRYPDDYSWLEINTQTMILNYMNGVQGLANRYYNKYMLELEASVDYSNNNSVEQHNQDLKRYLRLYNHTITSITGSKNAYATLGIMCEYNWPEHADKWILATKEDAINYNNFQETDADEKISDVFEGLLSYNDVGI